MNLVGPAFNSKKSNVQKRRLCVRIGNYKFPEVCLLCGSSDCVSQTPVEFKAVLLLGVIAGGETTTLAFPLCVLCSNDYLQRVKRSNLIMNASFIVGFGFIAISQILSEIAPRSLKSIPDGLGVCIAICSFLLIIASFITLLMKNRQFPIKFKHRGWILRDDDHHTFTFPNDKTLNRFIAANTEPHEGQQAQPATTTQSFDRGL